MSTLDAAKIARWRFDLDRLRPNRRQWRKVILNVKMLCEKRGLTIEDFADALRRR